VYQKSRAATAANTRFHHRKQHNTAKCNVNYHEYNRDDPIGMKET